MFKMLMNKFLYRWAGLISHNWEFLSLKRICNFYLLVFNPMRFIPPTQICSVSLIISICLV